MDNFRLDGKVVVLTGAAGGLGTRFARALNAAGARLVLSGRRTETLEEILIHIADDILLTDDGRTKVEPRIRNWPTAGPMISGPHLPLLVCTTAQLGLASGAKIDLRVEGVR